MSAWTPYVEYQSERITKLINVYNLTVHPSLLGNIYYRNRYFETAVVYASLNRYLPDNKGWAILDTSTQAIIEANAIEAGESIPVPNPRHLPKFCKQAYFYPTRGTAKKIASTWIKSQAFQLEKYYSKFKVTGLDLIPTVEEMTVELDLE